MRSLSATTKDPGSGRRCTPRRSPGAAPNGAPVRASLWSQFWSHSPPFTTVHGRPRPPVRAGHGRWRTVVNGGAQYSKACEGATLPWVQIPPPPPLTCTNTGPGRRQAHASCRPGLIYWSQLRVAGGPTVGISYGCCALSPRPRTGLNAGERKCARPRSVHHTVQGLAGTVPDWPDICQLTDRITLTEKFWRTRALPALWHCCGDHACTRQQATVDSHPGSVLVSFTPVRHRSPVVA